MSAPRIAAFVLATAAVIMGYRFGGSMLWIVVGAGLAAAAAAALYALYQDAMLRDVFTPRGFDVSSGVLAAAALYIAIVLTFNLAIAPSHVAGGLLRKCTLQGPLLPRLEPHGIEVVFEWVRTGICRDYGKTLGLVGPWRGVVVVVIALCEEIAWRGGVQQGLSERLGSTRGWLAASVLYGLVHLPTGGVLIAGLALVGGLIWGALYRYRGRLVPGLFSHAVFSYFLFHASPLVSFT